MERLSEIPQAARRSSFSLCVQHIVSISLFSYLLGRRPATETLGCQSIPETNITSRGPHHRQLSHGRHDDAHLNSWRSWCEDGVGSHYRFYVKLA